MNRDILFGMVYGQALGDAVGYYTEFKYEKQLSVEYPTLESFKFSKDTPVSFMRMKRTTECDWTDDTDQLILLLEMLIENNNKINPNLFAEKMYNWVHNGFTELGDTRGEGCGALTFKVVNVDMFIKNPIDVAKTVCGHNSSNGSLMRTAIMAFRNKKDVDDIVSDAVTMSLCTHYDSRCSVSVAVITYILFKLIQYRQLNIPETIPVYIIEKILKKARQYCNVYGGSYINECYKWFDMKTLDEMDLNNQIGYSLKCMAVGIWGLRNYQLGFKNCILTIILKGGDADTNAAVAGSIIGLIYGYKNLPVEWLEQLPNKKWLDTKLDKYLDIIS